jgi:cysteine desulfurase
MMKRTYFDHAATTPMRPEVLETMLPYFNQQFGNASSLHQEGQTAAQAIERARSQLAALIGASSKEIIFTSGGTESDNTALKGTGVISKKKHLIVSAIEHHAILFTAKAMEKMGYTLTILPVDSTGKVDPDSVKKAIQPDTFLISVMLANNEIGTIQPIREIASIAREAGVLMHTDAVQVVGNYPVNVEDLGCDMLSLSAHKFYGPKGIGALYVRKGTPIIAWMDGGEQEHGKRSGTYNTPGIVGAGKAAELAMNEMQERTAHVKKLRDYLLTELPKRVEDVRINGSLTDRLPNNIHLSVQYVEGESLLLYLDDAGFAVSTGSACSSHSLKISHVLQAIGLDAVASQGSLRITLGHDNTQDDVERFLAAFPKVVGDLRAISPLYKSKKQEAR